MTPESASHGLRTTVRAGNVTIGGLHHFTMIAGPCAVESESQIMETAEAVAAAGAQLLRGGCFKPRTSPYTFQGLGFEGLKLLRKAGDTFRLPVVTEAMTDSQVPIVAEFADVIQIGSRSMANVALLAAAAGAGRPVLLKRGMVATIDEMLEAAQFLVANGNPDVILCERGIRTFETSTRNTCDLVAVPVLRQRITLPVIVDPSHATGRRDLIAPLCNAAVAIGADGLMIEVHPRPDSALSDGEQSLSPVEFSRIMQSVRRQVRFWHEEEVSECQLAQ